jgi:hypothetical protein
VAPARGPAADAGRSEGAAGGAPVRARNALHARAVRLLVHEAGGAGHPPHAGAPPAERHVRSSPWVCIHRVHQSVVLTLFLTLPTHRPTHRLRKIKQLEGKFVFLLTISRIAHPNAVQGPMENKWGYHRSELSKYTSVCVEWLLDRCVDRGVGRWGSRAQHVGSFTPFLTPRAGGATSSRSRPHGWGRGSPHTPKQLARRSGWRTPRSAASSGSSTASFCALHALVVGVGSRVILPCCWCWVSGHSSHGTASNLTPRAPRQHNTRRTGTPAGRVSSRRGCTTATTRATGTNSRPS